MSSCGSIRAERDWFMLCAMFKEDLRLQKKMMACRIDFPFCEDIVFLLNETQKLPDGSAIHRSTFSLVHFLVS